MEPDGQEVQCKESLHVRHPGAQFLHVVPSEYWPGGHGEVHLPFTRTIPLEQAVH